MERRWQIYEPATRIARVYPQHLIKFIRQPLYFVVYYFSLRKRETEPVPTEPNKKWLNFPIFFLPNEYLFLIWLRR